MSSYVFFPGVKYICKTSVLDCICDVGAGSSNFMHIKNWTLYWSLVLIDSVVFMHYNVRLPCSFVPLHSKLNTFCKCLFLL